MPSEGSPRITFRCPQELLDAMDCCIQARNKKQSHDREWNRSDWLIQAMTDLLNKAGYGRKMKLGIKAVKVDDNMPREVEGDIDELMT